MLRVLDRAGVSTVRCVRAVGVLLSVLFLGLRPAPVDAQLILGAHAVRAVDAFDGTHGLGVRAGIDLPALPFDLMASGEYFFPDCAPSQPGCGLNGLTLDANFRFVFPVFRPYVSAGLAYRSIDPPMQGGDESVTGLGLGVGLDVALAGVRLFGESRYEFVDAPEKQFLWRLGVLFEVL